MQHYILPRGFDGRQISILSRPRTSKFHNAIVAPPCHSGQPRVRLSANSMTNRIASQTNPAASASRCKPSRTYLRMTSHAGMSRGQAGVGADLRACVAIAAVDAQLAGMMPVAEGYRLILYPAGLREQGIANHPRRRGADSDDQHQRADQRDAQPGVGGRRKDLWQCRPLLCGAAHRPRAHSHRLRAAVARPLSFSRTTGERRFISARRAEKAPRSTGDGRVPSLRRRRAAASARRPRSACESRAPASRSSKPARADCRS